MTTDGSNAAQSKFKGKKFSWRERGRSFRYALKGMRMLVALEHNARLHCLAAALAVIAGFVFSISVVEWCIIVLCIAAVFSLEAVNSAIEALADHVSPQFAVLIGRAKDMAAAAVLIFAIASVVIAALIFIPKILALL